MKQIDYNQIRLEDTGLYEDGTHDFGSHLYHHKITTVGQILDDDLMKKVLENYGPLIHEKELRGFIKLIKFKYLGIPINNKDTLEMKTNISKFSWIDILMFGFGFSRELVKDMEQILNNLSHGEKKDIKVLDLLIEIVNDENIKNTNPMLYKISKLNIESYNKSKNPSKRDEYTTLILLREQLLDLIDERNNLDAQIQDLQKKINELVKANTESGVSK